jgi:hypothetical protein
MHFGRSPAYRPRYHGLRSMTVAHSPRLTLFALKLRQGFLSCRVNCAKRLMGHSQPHSSTLTSSSPPGRTRQYWKLIALDQCGRDTSWSRSARAGPLIQQTSTELRADRWLETSQATSVIRRWEDLLSQLQRDRIPCLLLYGDTGNRHIRLSYFCSGCFTPCGFRFRCRAGWPN